MKIPSNTTLRKYGLSVEDWLQIWDSQNGICPICNRYMEKTVVIDHFHAPNWKKMPPEKRKLYVRGLTDWWCNKTFLGRGITVERAQNVVKYLKAFEKRKPK